MAIGREGWRMSNVAGCVERADTYLLDQEDARSIVDHQLESIRASYDDVADEAALSGVDRSFFRQRQILNPYALQGYPGD
jgi:serine/threonine-protein kinase HipA